MPKGQRSPFGELVRACRTRLNLTQLDLAMRTSDPARLDRDEAAVSERTIIAIERRSSSPGSWVRPRPSTVRALAGALQLTPDTPACAAFVAAAATGNPSASPIRDNPTDHAPLDSDDPPPLFVPEGRETQVERLRRATDKLGTGRPGVIFLRAGPGTGKTALITHVCREAVARHDGLVVLWGDCTGRSGEADPHQPFRQALGVLAGDTDAAGPLQLLSRENARRIRARAPDAIRGIVDHAPGLIDRFIPGETLRSQAETGNLDAGIARKLHRALDGAPGLSQSGLGLNELVFRTIAAYARSGPVILVLEDLHWADTGTTSMLFHLMRRLREQRLPLLVIGSWRPRHLEPAQPANRHPLPPVLLEAPKLFDDPILDLSTAVGGHAGRTFVDAMLSHHLPDAPPSLGATLFEQTAGLPLSVVAMLRWYRLDGLPASQASGDTDRVRIPSEIDALFSGLIGRLPPDLPPLLEAASVQGASFSAEVVRGALGLSQASAIEKLDAQLTRRFHAIEVGGVTTIAGRRSHEYQFAHAMLRDYLYARMSDLERQHYHAATAEAMLDLYGPGQHDGAGRIAFHFDRAGDRLNAAAAYLRAGDHAMDHQDYTLAARMFAKIGELGLREEDPFSVAQAHIGLGNCARGAGDNGRAILLFERARDIARLEGLLLVEANSLTSMGMLDFDAGRMQEGSERIGEAIRVLIELGDLSEACRSLALLSHTLHGFGRYDDAAVTAQRAIAMGTELRNDMFIVSGMIALANCWIDIGLYAKAIATYEKGLVICEEHGNLHRAAICWLNIALCEYEREAWDRAATALEPVFAIGGQDQ